MRLRQLREERNLTQHDFGKIFHAAQNTISNWERGEREIPKGMLIQIADYFNVSTDYILGRTENTRL